MTRISDAYIAVVHLRVVVHVHQDQSFRRQDEFHTRACAFWSNAACHVSMTLARPPIGLLLVHPWASTHIRMLLHACARVSFIMSTKLGLVDMYIPARVYDSCMAWLHTVCHVSAFACTFLGLISTISFLFGICGIWHLRQRRQRKCRRLQCACRNSFYRSGFLFAGVFSPAFWETLQFFEEFAFFSRCVWWSFPPFSRTISVLSAPPRFL